MQKMSASGHCSKVGRVWKWPAKGPVTCLRCLENGKRGFVDSVHSRIGIFHSAPRGSSLKMDPTKCETLQNEKVWLSLCLHYFLELGSPGSVAPQNVMSCRTRCFRAKHSTTSIEAINAPLPRLWEEGSTLLSAHLVSQLSRHLECVVLCRQDLENVAKPDQKPLNQAIICLLNLTSFVFLCSPVCLSPLAS